MPFQITASSCPSDHCRAFSPALLYLRADRLSLLAELRQAVRVARGEARPDDVPNMRKPVAIIQPFPRLVVAINRVLSGKLLDMMVSVRGFKLFRQDGVISTICFSYLLQRILTLSVTD